MDKRLAGLSFLLTLVWVTAVAFAMWHLAEPLEQRADQLGPVFLTFAHGRIDPELFECFGRLSLVRHRLGLDELVLEQGTRVLVHFQWSGAVDPT